MFDLYSQLREHAFLNDKPPTTWPEMVRQNRDRDVDPGLYMIHTKSLLSVLIAGLSAHFQRWQSNLLSQRSDRQVQQRTLDSVSTPRFLVDRKTPTHPRRG